MWSAFLCTGAQFIWDQVGVFSFLLITHCHLELKSVILAMFCKPIVLEVSRAAQYCNESHFCQVFRQGVVIKSAFCGDASGLNCLNSVLSSWYPFICCSFFHQNAQESDFEMETKTWSVFVEKIFRSFVPSALLNAHHNESAWTYSCSFKHTQALGERGPKIVSSCWFFSLFDNQSPWKTAVPFSRVQLLFSVHCSVHGPRDGLWQMGAQQRHDGGWHVRGQLRPVRRRSFLGEELPSISRESRLVDKSAAVISWQRSHLSSCAPLVWLWTATFWSERTTRTLSSASHAQQLVTKEP